MPLLTHSNLIREFYEEVKDKYPDLSFQRISEICSTPFDATKDWIKSGLLPRISIKYFGKFTIYPATIKELLRQNEVFFEKKKIPEELYLHRKRWYQIYLENLEAELRNDPSNNEIEIIDDEK